ncbi:MAG: thiol:disulfide interchange protein DsbA/DsbL [Cellvibrionaceae bacterium]|nr:thiol:disulfide interchange protein DsbA/DsbL [Cellvibrionaceae bacterium]
MNYSLNYNKHLLLFFVFAFFLMALLMTNSTASAQESFVAGKHYVLIDKPVPTADPKKIEVTEVFWYACPHCNRFHPVIDQWKQQQQDDVDVQHSPAMWKKPMLTHARIFYTAQALGLQEVMHKPVFDAIHIEKKRLLAFDEIFALFEKQGIARKKFHQVFLSADVSAKVKQADMRARSYGIAGTPEVIVNGKYRINTRMAGSQANMLKIADFLVNKERQVLFSR